MSLRHALKNLAAHIFRNILLRNTLGAVLVILLVVNLAISLRILCAAKHAAAGGTREQLQPASTQTGGELRIRDSEGQVLGTCPLQHTDVDADIVGHITRVHVRQTFANPLHRKIEAVYVFPLPHDAAVDDMTMTIGNRRIVGQVKPKEEARRTYETARAAGHVASLLDQERPNIFKQSVANIEPGAQIVIDISYVETLKYEDGVFEFVFPMVVGPRYQAGSGNNQSALGTQAQVNPTPAADASQLNPPVTLPDMRDGHDIRLTVHINGGAELFDVKSELHAINVQQTSREQAVVTLQNAREIPNKDFILRYRTATDQIQDAFFTHPFPGGAYFTLVVQPPRRVPATQARPKEMIFVIDRSGSQAGFPIEKAKETMRRCIENMNPNDTFNLISFSTEVTTFFDRPQRNTTEKRQQALAYLNGVQADGGTEMLNAVRAALNRPADPARLRIVCFMTDGYVNNDFEIIDTVKKHVATARVFAFGIGNSVNRFLLDGMAHAGRGEVEYVTLEKDGDEAARRFQERIQSPVLTDIRLDWNGLKASEIYPRQLPDLFSDKPILIHGLLKGSLRGAVTLHGLTAQGAFTRRIALHQPDAPEPHDALASLWARAKVKNLMMQDMAGLQSGRLREDLKQAITALGVQYRLMTQFTSFVAVEEKRRTQPGMLTRVSIPTPMPDGVGNIPAPVVQPTLMAQARAGDPLIRVQAPPDAEQVIALLPGGEIKRLLFDADRGEWLARFDIPTYAPEGDYFVRVVFVLKDGSRKTLRLRYRVDTTPPTGKAQTRVTSGSALTPAPASLLHLDLETGEDTARVAALLPWNERVELMPQAASDTTSGKRFAAQALVPPAYRHHHAVVTFIVTDRAHNRTTLTVDMSQ